SRMPISTVEIHKQTPAAVRFQCARLGYTKEKSSGMRFFSTQTPLVHRRTWQWLVPVVCVLLFLTTVIWLPHQAQQMESTERQEQLIADTLWVEQTIRFQLGRNEDRSEERRAGKQW